MSECKTQSVKKERVVPNQDRSKAMCKVRNARKYGMNTTDAWWYINAKSIDILAEATVNDKRVVTHVVLTRHQIRRAIEIMDK